MPVVPIPMVYILTFCFLAISAAVSGDMFPELFTPSVSSMMTFDLALLSRSRSSAFMIPSPMAVPSSMVPLAAIRVSALL